MRRLFYDYATFATDLKALAKRIDEPFDGIVAIARGGMTMAHMLGEYWGIREVFTINAVGYEGTRKLDRTRLFNPPDLDGLNRVLIVDDIADSGQTLQAVTRRFQAHYPAILFRTATLFYKPKKSCFEPTWWQKEADDAWIDFFWSEDLNRSSEAGRPVSC